MRIEIVASEVVCVRLGQGNEGDRYETVCASTLWIASDLVLRIDILEDQAEGKRDNLCQKTQLRLRSRKGGGCRRSCTSVRYATMCESC